MVRVQLNQSNFLFSSDVTLARLLKLNREHMSWQSNLKNVTLIINISTTLMINFDLTLLVIILL